jgi:hypothetical protein
MSINDPHLEAQMELESRSPLDGAPPPASFTRAQAWVLVGVAAAAFGGWLLYVFVR